MHEVSRRQTESTRNILANTQAGLSPTATVSAVHIQLCCLLSPGHLQLLINPLMPTDDTLGTAIKHPVPDWVKPSFVIFDIRALC